MPETLPTCFLCNQPVNLEKSKADEKGNTVHEECYVNKLIAESNSQEPLAV